MALVFGNLVKVLKKYKKHGISRSFPASISDPFGVYILLQIKTGVPLQPLIAYLPIDFYRKDTKKHLIAICATDMNFTLSKLVK